MRSCGALASGTERVSTQPVSRRLGEEFFQRDSLRANKQLALGLELQGKGLHAGQRFAAASAFHLNRNHRLALLQNEIHFTASFTPVGDADVGSKAGIKQVCADSRLNQPSPIIAVVSGFRE